MVQAVGRVWPGSGIGLTQGIKSTGSGTSNEIGLDIIVGAAQEFECRYSTSQLYIKGDIALGSYRLTAIGGERPSVEGVGGMSNMTSYEWHFV